MRPQGRNFIKKSLWHRCFSVNFAKFLRTPLEDYFCVCTFVFENKFIVRNVRKRWWNPSNDYESQRLFGDPFPQFLEIFHLNISLRHVWIDCVTYKAINFHVYEKLLYLFLLNLVLRFVFLKYGLSRWYSSLSE